MTEAFLGGFATFRLCRYEGNPAKKIVLPQFHNPWGYGVYFTENRLIGVSYRRIVSRAIRPGLLISLIWAVLLVSAIAYAILTHVKESLAFPFVMGLAVVALVYLVYLGPKQATNRTESQVVSSMWELENLPKDLVLHRNDISQVSVQGRRFYDPWGGGIVWGSLIIIALKTGQTVTFVNALRREKLRRLVELFQNYCSQDPAILFSVR